MRAGNNSYPRNVETNKQNLSFKEGALVETKLRLTNEN